MKDKKPFQLFLPPILHKVLKLVAAQRGKTMQSVIVDGWLQADRESTEAYLKAKRKKGVRE